MTWLLLAATSVHAQQSADGPIEEILVTGSRLIQDGNQAPTPLTVVNAEDLVDIAPLNLIDGLNQLPAFGPAVSPQNTGSPSGRGGNRLDLRNFGENRVLVLLDGRRHVASTTTGAVDVDLLPQGLISRVDVVTGGASAAYGSNAVSGVVNFILDKHFTGTKVDLKTGLSQRNDNAYYAANLAFGTPFADGRGHFLVNYDHHDSEGMAGELSNHRRRWQRERWQRVTLPSSMRPPQFAIMKDVNLSSASYGGLITSGPLSGITFDPGGTPRLFNFGELNNGQYMIGGERTEVDTSFIAPLKRESFFARASYDLTDSVSLYSEATIAETATRYRVNIARQVERNNSNYVIYRDNAYLPDSIANLMDENGLTEFNLSRFSRDWGYLENDGSDELTRFVIGAEGTIAGWDYDFYYQYGDTTRNVRTLRNPIVTRVYEAADAVFDPNSGAIVCRSTLTNPGNGCIPTNVFGEGAASQESIDWVTGTTDYDQNNTQQVVSFEASRPLFSNWAGPVSLATGLEYRHEKISQDVDPISAITIHEEDVAHIRGFPAGLIGQVGGYQQTNPQAFSGKVSVKEAFAEVVVPLLSGSPFAEALDLNAAGRYTDYSTSGSVFSWKVGLSYHMTESLRFRGTLSRDIRAPSAEELFTPSRESRVIVLDPFDGSSLPRNVNSVGNRDLDPEKAETWTVGVIYAPPTSGFSLALDYWHIDLKDAISTLSAQTLVDQCFDGATDLCRLIDRGANDLISTIRLPFLNVDSRVISGADIEAGYTTDLDDLVSGWNGSLGLRALFSYYEKDKTTVPGGGEPFNDAGGITNGVPHWKGRLSATYENGGLRLIAAGRYIGKGDYNSTYEVPTRMSSRDNSIPSSFVTDLTASYTFPAAGGEFEVYGTVTNLFDEDPPIVPTATASGNSFRATNFGLYDVLGRYYAVGIRIRY